MLRVLGVAALVASLPAWTGGSAEASELRIASWNLEHLNDAHGEGCVERSGDDFDAIARRIEALDADVVAFQEVENEAAARRVFDPARWNVVMSSRPDTGEGPTCYNRPEGRLQHQATGIAIRRSVGFRRGTDLATLAGGDPYLRWGTHVVAGRGEQQLHILSVHLKSGCWGAGQDAQGREACTVLRSQMNVLRGWIDERERHGERFAIAGDFNRRLAIPGDWAWDVLSPEDRRLELVTDGSRSHCDARFPDFIDHLVFGGPEGPIANTGSFREEPRDAPHPDHCAISVAIADGPPGSVATRVALEAWTSAFARTSTDQLVGGVARRLAQGPGSYATTGGARLFGEDGVPDLAGVLSRGSFLLSPSTGSGGNQWSVWGAGAAASMSASEHDLAGRVRSATLGADVERGPATLGIALMHSRGSGSTLPTGPIEAELSTIAPYAGIEPRDGVRVWGLFGKGEGKLRFEPTAGKPIRTDLETILGALGLRAELGETQGVQWATKADAALTALETGALADLAPIDSRVGRLRAGIEGSRRLELPGGAVIAPAVEFVLRHDTGDDRQGTAVEIGTGVHVVSADGRLQADGHARGYLAGDDANGWEVSGQLVMSPDALGRGLSFTLAPAWGGGGAVGPTTRSRMRYPGDGESSAGHLAAELGYAVAMGRIRGTVRPYAGIEWRGGDERTVRLGARWDRGDALRLSLEAERVEGEHELGTHGLIAQAELRW